MCSQCPLGGAAGAPPPTHGCAERHNLAPKKEKSRKPKGLILPPPPIVKQSPIAEADPTQHRDGWIGPHHLSSRISKQNVFQSVPQGKDVKQKQLNINRCTVQRFREAATGIGFYYFDLSNCVLHSLVSSPWLTRQATQ